MLRILSPGCPLVSLRACRVDVGAGCKREGRDRPSRADFVDYQRSSDRNVMAFVPAVPFAPPCRVASRPRTAPGARLHFVPARTVRLEPSASESPVYGRDDTPCTRHANAVSELGLDPPASFECLPGFEFPRVPHGPESIGLAPCAPPHRGDGTG